MSARPTVLAAALSLAFLLTPALALAQDEESTVSAADAEKGMDLRPAAIKVGQSPLGALLTDAQGRTLYAMDARLTRSRYGVSGADYCRAECAAKWTALPAPKGAAAIGRWKVVNGVTGPQWAWNNNPVFTYVGDSGPGAVAGDHFDELWTVIAYVPPVPDLIAPAAVSIVFTDGAYAMTDDAGHRLFTAPCADACKNWQRLDAGLVSRTVGQWTISREGDRAHWLFKGQPVFVASGGLPPGAAPLRP